MMREMMRSLTLALALATASTVTAAKPLCAWESA